MARIRTLKPEFWPDEKLGPMPAIDRLVFIGLISQADDAGRILDSVKLIDGLLFPHTDDSVREPLANLSRLGVIERGWAGNGQAVIQIVNWERHQKVDKPNLAAALPPIVQLQEQDIDYCLEHSREIRENVANDSRPIPTTNDQRPNSTAPLCAAEFDQFWSGYPKRAGSNPKKPAIRAWNARIQEGVSPAELLNGLSRYVQYCETTELTGSQFVLQAATFVGPSHRWEEAWDPPKPNGGRESFRGFA